MRRCAWRWAAGTVAAVAAGALLLGCGGGDDEPTRPEPTRAEPAGLAGPVSLQISGGFAGPYGQPQASSCCCAISRASRASRLVELNS